MTTTIIELLATSEGLSSMFGSEKWGRCRPIDFNGAALRDFYYMFLLTMEYDLQTLLLIKMVEMTTFQNIVLPLHLFT